jgi:hypothetical protein
LISSLSDFNIHSPCAEQAKQNGKQKNRKTICLNMASNVRTKNILFKSRRVSEGRVKKQPKTGINTLAGLTRTPTLANNDTIKTN